MKDKKIKKEIKTTADSLLHIYQKEANVSDNEQVEQWLSENKHAKRTIENLSSEEYLHTALKEYQSYQESEKRDSFIEKLNHSKRRRISPLVPIVALISVAVVVISFILFYPVTDVEEICQEKIAVVIDKPLLMTSRGDSVDVLESGYVTGGNMIAMTKIKKILHKEKDDTISMNRYIMPAKYSSKIELEDGTTVYLNSRSELLFPTSFRADKRFVQLKGEGFFEVAESAIPFIVEVEGVQVTVHGTKFNIKSYSDGIIETVLIDGSVGVKYGEEERQLAPKMMCIVNKNRNEVSIQQVNTDIYTAWIENKFMFERDSLEDVVRELSHWYNETIEFQNDSLKKLSVTLICQRKETLEEILQFIELSNTKIQFVKSDHGYIVK